MRGQEKNRKERKTGTTPARFTANAKVEEAIFHRQRDEALYGQRYRITLTFNSKIPSRQRNLTVRFLSEIKKPQGRKTKTTALKEKKSNKKRSGGREARRGVIKQASKWFSNDFIA